MRIIGETSKHGRLVYMTHSELAMIARLTHSSYDIEQLPVGATVDVSKQWLRLMKLVSNRESLDKAIQQIRAVATILEPLLPVVELPEDAPQ